MKKRNVNFDAENLNGKLDRRGYIRTTDESCYTDNWGHRVHMDDSSFVSRAMYFIQNNQQYRAKRRRK